MLQEGNAHSFRQIFMDGRKHPDDPSPTWFGHSIGHWEGTTLVIDTVGLNDRFWLDSAGTPHTEKLHLIERYTRTDYNTLQRVVTIDDPGTFTKPFDVTYTAKLGDAGQRNHRILLHREQSVGRTHQPRRHRAIHPGRQVTSPWIGGPAGPPYSARFVHLHRAYAVARGRRALPLECRRGDPARQTARKRRLHCGAGTDSRGARRAMRRERLMERHDPVVVVYDIGAPYEENWALFELCRATSMRDRRFVITSANPARVERLAGHDERIVEIVDRPFDLDNIAQAVREAARARRIIPGTAHSPQMSNVTPMPERRQADRRQSTWTSNDIYQKLREKREEVESERRRFGRRATDRDHGPSSHAA